MTRAPPPNASGWAQGRTQRTSEQCRSIFAAVHHIFQGLAVHDSDFGILPTIEPVAICQIGVPVARLFIALVIGSSSQHVMPGCCRKMMRRGTMVIADGLESLVNVALNKHGGFKF